MHDRKSLLVNTLLYLLCLYDIYLYLPDALDLVGVQFFPPDFDILTYFDAAMLLFGGILSGIILRKRGGTFNRCLGLIMITINAILTPLFIWKALP